MLLTEPTHSLSISHQMILLALAKTERIRVYIPSAAHNRNIHSLATTNYPTSPRRNSPTHSSHLKIQKISSLLFHQQARKPSAPENIQRLFRLQNCLSQKSSIPGNIQSLFRLQNCLSRKSPISRKLSKTFQAPATSRSNQQQQPAAATSSSDQQQQSTATTSCSSNQHSSYQQHLHNQRRLPLVITTVPSRRYPASS